MNTLPVVVSLGLKVVASLNRAIGAALEPWPAPVQKHHYLNSLQQLAFSSMSTLELPLLL